MQAPLLNSFVKEYLEINFLDGGCMYTYTYIYESLAQIIQLPA